MYADSDFHITGLANTFDHVRERAVHRAAAGVGQRNLLYTAITRAKKLVVLAGSRRALAAVRTVGASRRHTAFTHRLNP